MSSRPLWFGVQPWVLLTAVAFVIVPSLVAWSALRSPDGTAPTSVVVEPSSPESTDEDLLFRQPETSEPPPPLRSAPDDSFGQPLPDVPADDGQARRPPPARADDGEDLPAD